MSGNQKHTGEAAVNDFPDLPATLDKRRALTLPAEPVKLLKTAAVAEAAEKMFAKAKDETRLYTAVEQKLGAQRGFVIWWDEQQKHPGNKGAGRGNVRPSQTDDALKISDLGLDRDTVSRWRKKLADPRKFEETLEAAAERCRRICEADKGQTAQRGASGTGENEWYTPDEYLNAARDVLGAIDLDPASSDAAQEKVRASAYFTKDDDGLSREWNGRVWLNPPYAQPHIADFVSKMVAERRARRVEAAIMLTHNYTDTSWFHEGISVADAVCFTRGRIRFYDAKGQIAAPTQGQAFFYYGNEPLTFVERFASIGFVAMPWSGEA